MDYLHSELTEAIIGAFYDVYNILGFGFLEKAYENAMIIELRNNGLHVKQQQPIRVYFRGEVIGEYFADLIVNDLVIVELKASRSIIPAHNAQLLNYLKATKYEVGLLLNFGHTPKISRKAWSNDNKPYLQDKE
jgi:GxxExxY protein